MEKKLLFLLFMVSLFICTQAEATIMTFTGWSGTNYDIVSLIDGAGENYGSRISSSPVAYTGGASISAHNAQFDEGNGWTPNIEVAWAGGQPNDWDTYMGWRGEEVAQIQGASPGNPLDVVFTPDAGYGVLINSFDLDEWVDGGGCVVDWEVFDATGTLSSGTWIGNTAGYRSTVNTGLTTADMTLGNVVTLRFEQTAGLFNYLAMDNTNFDQFDRFALGIATNPSPANEQTDVPRDVVLSWEPGGSAAPTNGHIVYLGESFNDVNDGVGGITQSASSYDPGRLEFETTYYWRVDEVNAPPDSTIFKGDVWSFTTEPIGYAIQNITATASSTHQADMGPENTINDSGLDANDLHSNEETDVWLSSSEPLGAWIEYQFDKVYKLHQMWVWNSNQVVEPLVGFGLKDVTIEYSTNGTDYMTLGTTAEFARAPGAAGYAHNTTIDLGGAVAKYFRLTANSNWGGIMPQYGLSEVRFFYVPLRAREPSPDSGTTDVNVDVTLGFRAGREAAQHDVYLSTDEQAVIDGTAPVATVTEARHGPLSLDLDVTYYWRVDEVNEAETTTTWESNIWNFTTSDNIVVDDFESYNDLDSAEPESKRIFNVWIDGYGIATNGSLVGYEIPPFCEQTIVHGGEQSMPLSYANTGGAASSEAELTLTPAQNWTASGVVTLAVHFHGTAGNTGQLYVKINGTKVPYDGQASNLALTGWQAWNIDLASSGASLQNVTQLAIGIDGNGASGTLYFDDIGLYAYERQLITPSAPDDTRLIGHWKFDGNTQDSSGRGNHGTSGVTPPAFVAGKVGSNAMDFRGADYVVIDGVVDDITST
ncbi:MAG: discoidin domain-containing protein, partial [Planctomycetota bacterium]